MSRLLRRASEEIAAGHDVTMLRSDEVLTPNEAAEVLGVSRQYLSRLLDDGVTLMDLMLSMAEDFHRELLWSEFLLEEWERVIVRDKRRTPEQASAITGAIRQAFPSGRIVPGSR